MRFFRASKSSAQEDSTAKADASEKSTTDKGLCTVQEDSESLFTRAKAPGSPAYVTNTEFVMEQKADSFTLPHKDWRAISTPTNSFGSDYDARERDEGPPPTGSFGGMSSYSHHQQGVTSWGSTTTHFEWQEWPYGAPGNPMPFVPPGTEEPSPTGVDAHMGGGCKDTTSFGSVKTEDNWPAYQDKNEPNGAGPYQPMMPFAAPPMPPAGSSSQILAQYAANLQAMAQQYSQMASVAATQEMARGSELGNMPNMSMPALGMPINPWLLPDPLSMPGTGDFRRTEAEAKTNGKTELAPVKNESEWVTVMIRNLPNDYGRDDVVEFLNLQGFKARFDFVYLPIDFKNSTGLGYAFVNMVGHEDALEVFRRLEGFKDWKVSSQKVCEVAWGNPEQQGLDFHISRYRNSPVMHNSVPEEFKPLIFQNGEKVPFPEPTKAPRRPRMKKHARIGCRSPDASEEEEQGTQ